MDYFNRIKGAIDDRIKEEQARQAKAQQASRVTQRRPARPQDGSPARLSARLRDTSAAPATKGPDPADFALADDENNSNSQVTTPLPQQETVNEVQAKPTENSIQEPNNTAEEVSESKSQDDTAERQPGTVQELPAEIKIKLRKLEKLENKYGELLKAYRSAHARVLMIEPFEATLREITPLTSIADPSALSEYLTQITTKSGMVLEELKRVSGERDEYKTKAENLKNDNEKLEASVHELKEKVQDQSQSEAPAAPSNETKEDAISHTSPKPTASRLSKLTMFSPPSKPKDEDEKNKDVSEDLFSFDSEVPKLEAQLTERQEEIENLTTQVSKLKNDLKVARESTEGMVQTLETTSRELNVLRDAKEKFDTTESSLQQRIQELEADQESASKEPKNLEELSGIKSELEQTQVELRETKSRIQTLEAQNSETQEKLANTMREVEELNDKLTHEKGLSESLNEKVNQKDAINKDLEDSLAFAKQAEQEHGKTSSELKASEKKIQTMQGILDGLRAQLDKAEVTAAELRAQATALQQQTSTSSNITSASSSQPTPAEDITSGSKKNNKKKKKKTKALTAGAQNQEPQEVEEAVETAAVAHVHSDSTGADAEKVATLSQKIVELEQELELKRATIDRLQAQIRESDALREEIETLKDDLLHQGEEHVEARDALKNVQQEKQKLLDSTNELEKQLVEARAEIEAHADSVKLHKKTVEDLQAQSHQHNEVSLELQNANRKTESLQADLNRSEQLAAGRFKDITDLKDLLAKAQPELRGLRSEVEELKSMRNDLKNKTGELSRLESKNEEIKAELKNLGKRLSNQDNEIKTLRSKVETETKMRERAEGEIQAKESQIRSVEARRDGAIQMHESTKVELSKAKDDIAKIQAALREVEDTIGNRERQISGLKEELSLKTALHSSSQTLVQSLRDQMHELNVQTREATTRAESMEEELAEAQRMLAERTREGQTMRMLLNQADSGTEARIREMKERMDAAIEERDRLEDQHSVSSRRMTRDVEESKNKVREAQRQLKTLEAEKEDLEIRSREWRKLREDLEYTSKAAEREAEETRLAMKGLREALEESERQVADISEQKEALQQQADDAAQRIDKLSKANKNLTEEMKAFQGRPGGRPSIRSGIDSMNGLQSNRTSIDSSAAARSPAPPASRPALSSTTSLPRSETPTSTAAGSGLSQGTVDYVYLKTVLLQFLSQKDKGHQRQLIPVLGMLLHFDEKDQQRWNAAIAAR